MNTEICEELIKKIKLTPKVQKIIQLKALFLGS